MPTPLPDETLSDYTKRCVSIVLNEGTTDDPKQAYAICHSMYENKKRDAVVGNFNSVKKQVNQAMTGEKNNYKLIFDKYIEDAFNEGLRTAAYELGLNANDLYNTQDAKAIKDVLKKNATTINFELFDAIEKEVTLFLTDLELNNIPFTNYGLKSEIKKIFENKAARLQSQVVTETNRAANQGILFGYKKDGLITNKQWVAILDGRTTPICQRLNGEIVEIGAPFSAGVYQPPAHINCFVPDTLIRTQYGDKKIKDVQIGDHVETDKKRFKKVYSTMKRGVKEKLLKIKTNKGYMIVTKEHPILTNRGWIPAGEITKDDYLVYAK